MIAYSRIYEEIFYIDGSLRDIYILGTNEQDWQVLLDFLRLETYPIEFIVGGEQLPLPERIEDIFALTDNYGVNLRIDEAHLALHCHFFTREEIEFDLDPRDFHNEQQVLRLHDFMCKVGRLLNKIVILTPENISDCPFPYFRFDPRTGMGEWIDTENNIIT
ncbi:MAG TPA: hypothetical protein VGN34_05330 [Ktedonobacteraceae bacterium]|jgi:hypothetical protein